MKKRVAEMTTRAPWTAFEDVLMERRPFKTRGALKGVQLDPDYDSYIVGRLPEEYHGRFSQADYAVYSYGTPIAWHVTAHGESKWHMPNEGYSVTTTRHQNKIATALRNEVLAK